MILREHEFTDLPTLTGPMRTHVIRPSDLWGRQDPHIPREGRRLIQNTLTDRSVNFTWHEVNGQRAFLRDEGPRYDPELALLAWNLILAMLRRCLLTA